MRKRDSSSIGWLERIWIATKASISTAAPISEASIWKLDQPSGFPRTRLKTSRKSEAEKVAAPGQSTGSASGARDSASLFRVSAIAAIPIGTLTKKIHSQPRPSVSTPPTRGPIATAPPIVAPQIPKAVARSGPWNSWAISARVVASIPAAPIPWTARKRLSIVGSVASPQASEATVKIPKPIVKTRRRPIRSPSDPAVSSSEASVSA